MDRRVRVDVRIGETDCRHATCVVKNCRLLPFWKRKINPDSHARRHLCSHRRIGFLLSCNAYAMSTRASVSTRSQRVEYGWDAETTMITAMGGSQCNPISRSLRLLRSFHRRRLRRSVR